MSVMICSNETFKRTAKVLCAYTESMWDDDERLPLEAVNGFVRDIANLNYQVFSDKYNEDIELDYEEFEELPETELSVQDIMSARCWRYQIEGDFETDSTYCAVYKAIEWAMKEYKYTDEQYDNCKWG